MPVMIHNKEYITVDERVIQFHNEYPNGSINSIMTQKDGSFIFKATATPDIDKPERFFTGHAEEVIGSSQINKTSALENCETSAVGRCLGFLNIGLINSIATAEEVTNAIHQQKFNPMTKEQAETIIKLSEHKAIKGETLEKFEVWIRSKGLHSFKDGEKAIERLEKIINDYDGLEN